MGKHETGYARVPRDFYPTPSWVTAALAQHINVAGKRILEPACGDGRMAEALKAAGAKVYCTDIEDRGYAGLNGLVDFILATKLEFQWDATSIGASAGFDGVITNPPFGDRRGTLAKAFIKAGLRRMGTGFLALLLPADFDSGRTRAHLFGHCPCRSTRLPQRQSATRRNKHAEHCYDLDHRHLRSHRDPAAAQRTA